jgi:HEAT repeat protein
MRFSLLVLVIAWGVNGLARADVRDDEQVLSAAKVETDGPALLAFLQKYTPAIEPKSIEKLIRKLGSEDFAERERTMRIVVSLGPRAAAYLREALQDPDPELAMRARRCLQVIDAGPGPDVQAAAVRLLAVRKPAGAAEVLLNYLPFAPNDAVTVAVQQALDAVAVRDGKPEPALVAALKDKHAARRMAAGVALIRGGGDVSTFKLLDDKDVHVRLRFALELVERKDKKAVPVLIDLLALHGKMPAEEAGAVEAVLFRLAGERAPTTRLGADSSPEKKRDLWAAWWKENEGKIDLAAPNAKLFGYTMILSMDDGKIAEIQTDGKVRWQFDGLSHPMSAQLLDQDRVLVAEYRGMRVTERDLNGKVLWEKKVTWPVAAQRFADGHTFIATRSTLMELDKDGKEVYAHALPGQIIMAAQKMKNGNIGCVTSAGTFILLDSQGKELHKFQAGAVDFGCGFDVLPNGHVLVPEFRGNKVIERDRNGKEVWSVSSPAPHAAVRLPNGNTLIASASRRHLTEVDPKGRTVWEYRSPFGPTRVQRR